MAMNEDGNASALLGLSEDEKRARELGRRISVEAEAWKIAQLAVILRGTRMPLDKVESDLWCEMAVASAIKFLAESRRQAGASTGGEADHG